MSNIRPIDRWFIDEVLPHEARYLGAALRLVRDSEDARDVVQEVYVKLFNTDGWRAIDNPPGYVMRMIHNLAVERMRRARIVSFQQLTDAESINLIDDAPDAFREAASRHEVRRVMAALDTLPEPCRAAVLRRRFGEETPTEIARATGQSLSTLEKRLARGMEMLTAALSLDGTLPSMRKRERLEELPGDPSQDDAAIG